MIREPIADQFMELRSERAGGFLQIAFTAAIVGSELRNAGKQQVPADGDAQDDEEQFRGGIHDGVGTKS